MIDPDRIQQFCQSAVENGTMQAACVQLQREMYLEWCSEEDQAKREQLWHTAQALELVQRRWENFAMNAQEVSQFD